MDGRILAEMVNTLVCIGIAIGVAACGILWLVVHYLAPHIHWL